jgi:cytochrome P450
MDKARAAAEMAEFFTAAFEERRVEPRGDLLSELVAATAEGADESGDEPLTMPEILDIAYQLLIAGNETTTQLLGEIALMFVEHPENWERLRADRSLIPQAVEEALRWSSPIVGMMHFCRKDSEVAGTTIPENSIVGVMFGGANHDDRVFPQPDEYILDRPNAVHHLAFGNGIHTCLGAPLARAEARIALDTMLDELPGPPNLVPGAEPERGAAGYSLRGLTKLPLTFRG